MTATRTVNNRNEIPVHASDEKNVIDIPPYRSLVVCIRNTPKGMHASCGWQEALFQQASGVLVNAHLQK